MTGPVDVVGTADPGTGPALRHARTLQGTPDQPIVPLTGLVEALRDAAADVVVVCGLGGGGEALARSLIASRSGGAIPGLERHRLAEGDVYKWPGGQLVDMAVRAGLGRQLVPTDGLITPRPGGGNVYLLRDRADTGWLPPGEVVDLRESDSGAEIFRDLLAGAAGLSLDTATQVAAHYGNATALVPELTAWTQSLARTDSAPPGTAEVLAACRTLPLVDSLLAEMTSNDDTRALDIGRVLCLFRPRELECGDAWAEFASRLLRHPYSVSDITLCLFRFPALFVTRWAGERLMVRPSSPMAVTLLQGHVRPAPSEHRRLYQVLRDAGVTELATGRDVGEAVRQQLPRQAIEGAAIGDLTMDALALLCCDPATLVAELERDRAHLRQPGAKAALLCAHRLFVGHDQASHLELSGYRVGLDGFSDKIEERLPQRPWRATWARSQFMNTHRVLLNGGSPALSICAVQASESSTPASAGGWLGETYVGCSNGSLWHLSACGLPSLVWHEQDRPAEIRAVASAQVGESIVVGIGTSDHAIAAIDSVTGKVLWRDEDSHTDPLSTVTTAGSGDGTVLVSAGVSNKIWVHRLRASQPDGRLLYTHTSEIRGLAVVATNGGELLVFAAVDGTVGIVEMATGRLAASSSDPEEVLNSVAVARADEELIIVAGSSNGRVIRFGCHVADLITACDSGDSGAAGDRASPPQPTAREGSWAPSRPPASLAIAGEIIQHGSSVNCVRLVQLHGELAVISTSSDSIWRWTWLKSGESAPVVGHVGPVWSAVPAVHDGRLYVVTAGGEGACRAWLADMVLHEKAESGQPSWHLGGVTSVAATIDERQRLRVVTGGANGDVRSWLAEDINDGGRVAQHTGQISALICGYKPSDASILRVVSGSLDGPLQVTEARNSEPPTSVVLGIAHEGVTALAVLNTPEQQILISGGLDGTLTAWDLESRQPRATVSACRYGAVQSLSGSGWLSGEEFIVGGQDGSVSLWHATSLAEHRRSNLGTSVLSLCPIPGQRLGWVAALADGNIAVIRDLGVHTENIAYIPAHHGEVRAVSAFMLAGRPVVVSAGLDRHLRLFDLDSRVRLLEIALDGYVMCSAAHSPFFAVGTSAGALVLRFAENLPGLVEEKPGEGQQF